jgi:hypothetical protein
MWQSYPPGFLFVAQVVVKYSSAFPNFVNNSLLEQRLGLTESVSQFSPPNHFSNETLNPTIQCELSCCAPTAPNCKHTHMNYEACLVVVLETVSKQQNAFLYCVCAFVANRLKNRNGWKQKHHKITYTCFRKQFSVLYINNLYLFVFLPPSREILYIYIYICILI